ncbi:SLAM family member 7 isoform X2 [Nothobranchius furzeri]|uniref:Transcript variant X2 n=1 Tax=Nothobranchius furzeri TaxID=105023 RepID=A0A9D3BVP4_NOTFU|nr:uncharacterized protein LOC107383467 isoform X3 [Nothobranchius furzeri]KAF7221980.1 transcript variant X2 [Nothobranchius furzeri]
MACPTLLCAVFLLYQTQGSSAGTPVFVPTGGDLNLDVSDADFPKTFDLFFWKFKTENVMVTYQPNGEPNIREEYRRRIEVSEKKYSVRLKHLTKGDSGTYVARVTAGKDRILAEYDVTVQDPVSPVDLISDSVSKNSTCNVTAACTTPESSISSSFRCFWCLHLPGEDIPVLHRSDHHGVCCHYRSPFGEAQEAINAYLLIRHVQTVAHCKLMNPLRANQYQLLMT